jgi:hypothetical protein
MLLYFRTVLCFVKTYICVAVQQFLFTIQVCINALCLISIRNVFERPVRTVLSAPSCPHRPVRTVLSPPSCPHRPVRTVLSAPSLFTRCCTTTRIYVLTKHNTIQWLASSGMSRRVVPVRADVSEELSTSFIRVIRIGELGTMLAVTNNRRTLTWYFFAVCVGC